MDISKKSKEIINNKESINLNESDLRSSDYKSYGKKRSHEDIEDDIYDDKDFVVKPGFYCIDLQNTLDFNDHEYVTLRNLEDYDRFMTYDNHLEILSTIKLLENPPIINASVKFDKYDITTLKYKNSLTIKFHELKDTYEFTFKDNKLTFRIKNTIYTVKDKQYGIFWIFQRFLENVDRKSLRVQKFKIN